MGGKAEIATLIGAPFSMQPIEPDEAARGVAELYGMRGRLDRLASERDQTLLFAHDAGTRCILKIYHPGESEAVIAFQLDALRYLEAHAPDLPVPRVILPSGAPRHPVGASPDRWGTSSYALHRFSDGTTRIVSMLSFLDGERLDQSPSTPLQAQRLGAVLANLGWALREFEAPAPTQDPLWNLSNAAAALPLAREMTGPSRNVVESVLRRFEREILPRLERLPSQVIHHDFNPHNVLTVRGDPDRIAAVIDFGDLTRAPRVNDLAVALAWRVVARLRKSLALEHRRACAACRLGANATGNDRCHLRMAGPPPSRQRGISLAIPCTRPGGSRAMAWMFGHDLEPAHGS